MGFPNEGGNHRKFEQRDSNKKKELCSQKGRGV
jgi:hypothetical protein